MRGAHRGVWCSKGTLLIEAELFAAESKRPAQNGRALLCAANYAREIQGITASRNLPDARNRAPVTPVSLHISDVSAQRRVWGSQEGAREPYGALAPFCLRRQTAAMHSPCHGEHPPAREGLSRLQRRTAVSAENFASAFGKAERALIACGGKPPERRNRFPSADGITSKKRAFRLSLELEYDAREGAHADEHDRMHLRQLPDRDRKH